MLRSAVRSSLVALAAVGVTAPAAGAALPRPLPASAHTTHLKTKTKKR